MTDFPTVQLGGFTYVFLAPQLWQTVEMQLGKQMLRGRHDQFGDYLEENAVRYVRKAATVDAALQQSAAILDAKSPYDDMLATFKGRAKFGTPVLELPREKLSEDSKGRVFIAVEDMIALLKAAGV